MGKERVLCVSEKQINFKRMGTGKMSFMKFYFAALIIILINTGTIFSQAEYVQADHPVYQFLERMEAREFIVDYNSFQIPKTRREIASYLKRINFSSLGLSSIDIKMLDDYLTEFELELLGSLKRANTLIGEGRYDLFTQDERYLYFINQKDIGSLFINLNGEGNILLSKSKGSDLRRAVLGIAGAEIRGTLLNKFGFNIKGTNGKAFGDKQAAYLRKELRYNFKFNEKPDEAFFDNAQGYLSADFDLVRFKFGNDRLKIGYGVTGAIVDDNSPQFDYVGMDIRYSIFTFSYFHGKIMGRSYYYPDPETDGSTFIGDKYLGYHRLGFDITNHINIGLGEFIIYGERPLEFAYLNPFNFYKSAEHSLRDRDNAMMFIDFNANIMTGMKAYGSFLLDDMKFGQIGKGWYGNETMLNLGIFGTALNFDFPVDYRVEYKHIEPYVFTHRLMRNSFTNEGYPIGTFSMPNSELIFTELTYRFSHRLNLIINFMYRIHGANPVLPNGDIINIGGDINLGHRTFDTESVHFLDGIREYDRRTSAAVRYEPYNNILFFLRVNYINSSLQNMVNIDELQSFFSLSLKL